MMIVYYNINIIHHIPPPHTHPPPAPAPIPQPPYRYDQSSQSQYDVLMVISPTLKIWHSLSWDTAHWTQYLSFCKTGHMQAHTVTYTDVYSTFLFECPQKQQPASVWSYSQRYSIEMVDKHGCTHSKCMHVKVFFFSFLFAPCIFSFLFLSLFLFLCTSLIFLIIFYEDRVGVFPGWNLCFCSQLQLPSRHPHTHFLS